MAKKIGISCIGIIAILLSVLPFFMNGKEVKPKKCFEIKTVDTIYKMARTPAGWRAYDPDLKVTGSTNDASTHTFYTYALPNAGSVIRLNVDMLAKTGTVYFRARKTATIANNAGTLRVVDNSVEDFFTPAIESGIGGAGFTITFSSTNAIVQVSGIAATTVNWSATITKTVD